MTESTNQIAFCTRSMSDELFLRTEKLCKSVSSILESKEPIPHFQIKGSSSKAYFRHLSKLDADFVVNIDEDAFLLDPIALIKLINYMNEEEYAICGVPDGGAIKNRKHNPVACNAFFNVINLRRVRPCWSNWARVRQLRHRVQYEKHVQVSGCKTTFAFDNFEPYYCVFFALLEANEQVLYLPATSWDDNVSTVVQDVSGNPIVLHTWYSRQWRIHAGHRERINQAWIHSTKFHLAKMQC